jgi:glycosyltransferase involved in cell wall biosynthesis
VRSRTTKPLILHVAAFRNPAGGGFVESIARLGQLHEFQTALLCPSELFSWVPQLRAAGVRVHCARSELDVVTTIARLRPDVVHAHFVAWSVPAMIGAAGARARLAWHLHSGVPHGRKAFTLARRLKYAAAKRFVDRFYCVSPDLVEYLESFGIARAQIAELPNGVNLERYRPPTLRERVAARRHYALAPDDRAVLFFGRDHALKGADRLALALKGMTSSPKVLAAAADRESIALLRGNDVRDLGQTREIREAMWAADALAMPSRSEGLAYSLLEARACGLPAVASSLPGIARSLASDPGTTLLDAADAGAFARALDAAIERGAVPLPENFRSSISIDRWAESLAAWYVTDLAA